jgi:hypothetical protein
MSNSSALLTWRHGECEQKCGQEATVYAMDPRPGGWGGRYCGPCANDLRFRVTDRLATEHNELSELSAP